MATKDADSPRTPRIVNRKARHDYSILATLEVGLALRGSEVKSIRQGQVSLAEGYAMVHEPAMELFLHDVDIAPYAKAHGANSHEPKRVRKLLAHRREILRLHTQCAAKGATLVPLAMYFVRGNAKLELGVAVGKKRYDKRQAIKSRDADRDLRRAMGRRRDG